MVRVSTISFFLLLFEAGPLRSQTLQYLGLGQEATGSIAADRTNTNIIYVGSVWNLDSTYMTPGGVFKTTNGGTTWDTLLRGFTVLDLDLSPTNPQTIYATLGTSGIKKSLDGGETWAAIDSDIAKRSINGQRLRVLAIDPIHPDTLYLGASGPLGAYSYKSTDQGKN